MPSSPLKEFLLELHALANPQKAIDLQWFFKTGKGEYGEGDKFLGIRVPQQRALIKHHYLKLSLHDIAKLLSSKWHEERFAALLILVAKYQQASKKPSKTAEPQKIYDFYLENTHGINNWDLVDTSAPHIVGHYLFNFAVSQRTILHTLADSPNLWERRIAVVATQYFIRNNLHKPTLDLAEKLLSDKEDLMHKAVGWMLREVGARDVKALENFLRQHYSSMPRTMLRYAIEHFEENKRQKYLKNRDF